jgi:carbamoyl-phosphate synthase large subunit
VLGWKEYEMEVVRDRKDNCIIVCSIENFDAMGVHTGDSITVAPAQTLTDKEYQIMRDASLAVLREIGVDTGGSNVQFAINPADGRMIVIEMNPRVSRSSALASKATGFPDRQGRGQAGRGLHARRAAQRHHRRRHAGLLRAEHRLRRHQDAALRVREVPAGRRALTTQMKSVGEVMAIGRTFQESLQKALRGLETDHGLESSAEGLRSRSRSDERSRAAQPRAPSASFTWPTPARRA